MTMGAAMPGKNGRRLSGRMYNCSGYGRAGIFSSRLDGGVGSSGEIESGSSFSIKHRLSTCKKRGKESIMFGMKELIVETSGDEGLVAVLKDGHMLGETRLPGGPELSKRLGTAV